MLRFYLLILLTSFTGFLLPSCSKIELPTEEEKDNNQKDTDDNEEDYGDILTVAQAKAANEGEYAAVVGYIVGYVKGTSLTESNAIFSIPSESPNTNMLLADREDETNYQRCFPVSLPAKTTYEDIRGELNLFDNPHLFHRRIAVEGELTTYFRTMGMKKMVYYMLLADNDENGDSGDSDDDGNNEEVPDEPPVAPQEPIGPPTLDDNEQLVPEGR